VFIINNCTDCSVYVFDHTDQVTIDNCRDCRIVIAACSASLFVRNCTACDMVLGCQQFRSRDCSSLRILLYSDTRPIIEASRGMQFGCYRLSYFLLPSEWLAPTI
jgi:protein XRP2